PDLSGTSSNKCVCVGVSVPGGHHRGEKKACVGHNAVKARKENAPSGSGRFARCDGFKNPIIILKEAVFHGLFRLPCQRIKFSGISLQCINLASGPAGTMQPFLSPPQVATAVQLHPQSVHPSVSIGNIQVFHRPLLLLPAVATLPEAAVSMVVAPLGARPSRLLEKEGKKTGGVTSGAHGKGVLLGLGPSPNPLVCLCILLWETHSVKPSSHLPICPKSWRSSHDGLEI
ncbi:hypothetical protein E2320_006389, partial [Naja naja]